MKTRSPWLIVFALLCLYFSATAQTPGSFYAIGLGGKSAHVSIPDDSSLNFTGSISIEAWIKPDSFKAGNNDNCILSKHGANGGYDLRCNKNGGVNFRFGTSTGWQFVVSTSKLTTGQWYHIASTYNGDSMCMYVNGVLERVKYFTGRRGTSYGLLAKIGEFSRSGISALPGGNFDGQIDEVRLWSAALSASDVKKWMCMKLNKSHPNINELQGHWRCDDAQGATISDYSSFANHGSSYKVNWLRSGAPLGDTAVFSATGTFSYRSLQADQVEVRSINTLNKGAYLYQVFEPSTDKELQDGFMHLDSQYLGFYSLDSSLFEYELSYAYNSSRAFVAEGECHLDVVQKVARTDDHWKELPTLQALAADSLYLSSVRSQELHLVRYFDKRKLTTEENDSIICTNERLKLQAYGNSKYTYQWYRNGTLLPNDTLSTLKVSDSARYTAQIAGRSGCQYQSVVLAVATLAVPTVRLNRFKPQCEYVDSFVLTGGSPAGGSYSGFLVVKDSLVLPSSFTSGSYPLYYSFTDSNNCSNTDTQTFIIQAKPKASFTGATEVCDNKDSIHLRNVTLMGGRFSGPGVRNNVFYTDSVKTIVSEFNITYYYSDSAGCLDTAYGKVRLQPSSLIQWPALGTTCENVDSIKLVTNAKPSVFSGNGVVGEYFYPALAGTGIHTLSTTFTNIHGCVSNDSNQIDVKPVDKTSFTMTDSLCENADSVKLTNASPLGGSFLGPGVLPSGYFSTQLGTLGANEIAYTYSNTWGCTDTARSILWVKDTIALSQVAQGKACQNDSPVLLNQMAPAGGNYYVNGLQDSFFRNTAQFNTGIHQIFYQYMASNGCVSEAFFPFEVLPQPSVDLKLERYSVCQNGDSVLLLPSPAAGGVLRGLGIRNDYIFPAAVNVGASWYYHTFTDTLGCSATDSASLDILAVPNTQLTIDSSFCKNEVPILLMGSGSPAGIGGRFSIDGTEAGYIRPSVLTAGQHQVVYSYTNTVGCKDSILKIIEVHAVPIKPSITAQNDSLFSSATAGNQWFEAAAPIPGATAQGLLPGRSGHYYVVVSNAHCNTQSDSFYVEVLSVKNGLALGTSIYPNPCQAFVLVESNDAALSWIRIFNTQGKLLSIIPAAVEGKSKVPTTQLIPGVYWLEIESDEGHRQRFALIKN